MRNAAVGARAMGSYGDGERLEASRPAGILPSYQAAPADGQRCQGKSGPVEYP